MKLRTIAFLTALGILALKPINALHNMATVMDAAIAFKELKKSQKNDWFNFMKKEKIAKADIFQNHFNQWKDFEINKLKSWKNNMQATPDQMLSMKRDALLKAVELYEKQRSEWRNLCKEQMNTAKELDAKHTQALNAFKRDKLKIEHAGSGGEIEEVDIEIDDQ